MTVKELAKECDVHYNTMRKWLIDNEVKKTNNTKNAQFLLTKTVIKNAKNHFIKGNKETSEKDHEDNTENYKNIDDFLVQQVSQKDKQIVKQQEQILHLQKLLENQQILTLQAQEKVRLLENKEEPGKRSWFDRFKKN